MFREQRPATLEQMTPEEWRRVLAVKLDAHLLGARAIVPPMRKAGGGSSSPSLPTRWAW
ncbi:hypothetical protein [Roseomonas elaeocarpi]|uniref:Uncharacterized protein n=1 Tax=Roseomonas elaeocarpi TaxID=907779 RepID=A0ABV6JPS5_9PROT